MYDALGFSSASAAHTFKRRLGTQPEMHFSTVTYRPSLPINPIKSTVPRSPFDRLTSHRACAVFYSLHNFFRRRRLFHPMPGANRAAIPFEPIGKSQ